MLRVLVTRETATEAEPIAEVVIGKFAGGERRAGYAARVYEPPSAYSGGVDACFAVRGHERYQPAFALVASVLGAWREGRVDDVGEGVRAALTQALASRDTKLAPVESAMAVEETSADQVTHALGVLSGIRADDPRAPSADALMRLLDTTLSAIEDLATGNGPIPSAQSLNAATALTALPGDRVMTALAEAVNAAAER